MDTLAPHSLTQLSRNIRPYHCALLFIIVYSEAYLSLFEIIYLCIRVKMIFMTSIKELLAVNIVKKKKNYIHALFIFTLSENKFYIQCHNYYKPQ